MNNEYEASVILANENKKLKKLLNDIKDYIKDFIEFDQETGTYSVRYYVDGSTLKKILDMIEGEDNE